MKSPGLFGRLPVTMAAATLGLAMMISGPAHAEDHKLAVQIYPGIFLNLLPWVAEAKGFYKDNGVEVDLVPLGSGPQGLAALQGGSIQLAMNNTDVMMLANDKGLDLQMVVGNWGQQFTIFGREGFELPHLSEGFPAVMKDVEGHNVGVSARGSGTEFAMRVTLSEAGLDPESVTYVAVGGTTGQVPALRAGQVDVVVVPLEGGAVLRAMGLGTPIVDFQQGEGPEAFQKLSACYSGFFGQRSWVSENGETLKRFIQAHKDAEAWARDPANLDELVELALSEAPKEGVPDPKAMAKDFLSKAPFQTEFQTECIAGWNEMLTSNKLLDKPMDPQQLVWQP